MAVSDAIRRAVEERANYCCEYCLSQQRLSHADFSVEHVLPHSRGGTDTLPNLALSCQACNNRKFTATEAIDTETGEVVPLYHPRRHHWSTHFTWTHDYTRLIGLTPTGRATITRLDLNRANLVEYRRALIAYGKHLPALMPTSGKDNSTQEQNQSPI